MSISYSSNQKFMSKTVSRPQHIMGSELCRQNSQSGSATRIIMDAEQAIFAPGGITPEERAIMQQTQAITGTIGLSLTTILWAAMAMAAAAVPGFQWMSAVGIGIIVGGIGLGISWINQAGQLYDAYGPNYYYPQYPTSGGWS